MEVEDGLILDVAGGCGEVGGELILGVRRGCEEVEVVAMVE